MVNVQITLTLVLVATRLFLGLGVVALSNKFIWLSRFSREPQLLCLVILSSSIHLLVGGLHGRFHFLVHYVTLVLSHLLLLSKRATLWFVVDILLLSHHTSLILPILNHYLRTLLLTLIVHIIILYPLWRACSWLLLLAVVKAVWLSLFRCWSMRATCRLITSIVLVLFTSWVLVEHFAGTVHRVGNAIDLLLILSTQTIVIARLFRTLCLIVTLLFLWRLPHIVAYHTNSAIYQFSLALLLSLVDACLSKVRTLSCLLLSRYTCR